MFALPHVVNAGFNCITNAEVNIRMELLEDKPNVQLNPMGGRPALPGIAVEDAAANGLSTWGFKLMSNDC